MAFPIADPALLEWTQKGERVQGSVSESDEKVLVYRADRAARRSAMIANSFDGQSKRVVWYCWDAVFGLGLGIVDPETPPFDALA